MKRKSSFKEILWAGVVLWLVSVFARIVLSLCGNEMPGQDVLFDMLGTLNGITYVVALMVLLGIIAPILEEFLFRYWIKSRKKVVTILLFAAMGAYVALSTFWWLGVISFLVCVMLDYFLIDNSNARTIMLMLATSLLFSVAHITEFSEFNIDAILCMTELFGLALVACWLVYNKGFWWACLLHALNNLFALLIIILAPKPPLYNPTAMSFETPLYSASLQPLMGDTIDSYEINDSTLVLKGSLPVIALDMVRKFNPDIISGTYSSTEYFKIHISYRSNEPCWKYTLTFHDTIPYKRASHLVADLAMRSRLRIDTTYDYMYVIGIEDMQKLNASKGEDNTLVGLAEDLRIVYDCPVVLEKGTNEFFPIKYSMGLFQYPYDVEDLPNILVEKLGLFMYQSTVHKIQTITFFDCSK